MFRFHVVQLNRFNWRDFLEHTNPISCALMARMQVAPADRPRVKAECLRLLTGHRLEERKHLTVSKFIDRYLLLDEAETETDIFKRRVQEFKPEEQDRVNEYITSWERDGMVKGRVEGRVEGYLLALATLLQQRFGQSADEFLAGLRDETDLDRLQRLMTVASTAPDLQSLRNL